MALAWRYRPTPIQPLSSPVCRPANPSEMLYFLRTINYDETTVTAMVTARMERLENDEKLSEHGHIQNGMPLLDKLSYRLAPFNHVTSHDISHMYCVSPHMECSVDKSCNSMPLPHYCYGKICRFDAYARKYQTSLNELRTQWMPCTKSKFNSAQEEKSWKENIYCFRVRHIRLVRY